MVGNSLQGWHRSALILAVVASMAFMPTSGLAQSYGSGTVEYTGATPVLISGGSIAFANGTTSLATLNVDDAMHTATVAWTVAAAYCQVEVGEQVCTPADGVTVFCNGVTLRPSNFDPAMDTYVYVGGPFGTLAAVADGRSCDGVIDKPATTGVITYWPKAS